MSDKISRIVAVVALLGCGGLAAAALSWRSEVSQLREAVGDLKKEVARKQAVAPAPRPAVAPSLPSLLDPSRRVSALESEIQVLRQSIDRIGKALGDLATAGDRSGQLGGDGGDPVAALLSDDPKRRELFGKAVTSAVRQWRRKRWQRWRQRRASRVVAAVNEVAKEKGWSTEKTEKATSIVKDLRQNYRQTRRSVWRGEQTASEAIQSLQTSLGSTRDQLVSLLGAGDYEAFREAYNRRATEMRRLRRYRSPRLPPAR